MRVSNGRAMRVVAAGSLAVMTAALSGCGGATSGFEPESQRRGIDVASLLAFNSLKAPPLPAAGPTEVQPETCPDIEVLDGTAATRVYAGAEQSNSTVRYQFSMGETVRECRHEGDQLVLKVGAEGRVLLGPAGQPGGFAAPVRIAIRDEKTDKAIVSKLYQVPVTVSAGDTGAPFSIVSDQLTVPYRSDRPENDYTVVVGFDPKGDGRAADVAAGGRKRKHRATKS